MFNFKMLNFRIVFSSGCQRRLFNGPGLHLAVQLGVSRVPRLLQDLLSYCTYPLLLDLWDSHSNAT